MAKITMRAPPTPTGNPQQDAVNLAQFEINSAAEDQANGVAVSGAINTLGVLNQSSPVGSGANSILDAATATAGPIQSLLGKLQLPTTPAAAAQAVGITPPVPTPANPTAGRTFFGMPVVDVAVGAVVLGGLAWMFRNRL